MSDKLQILIEALLKKTTKQQLMQELKNIEKGLKPIEISVSAKAETQTKLFNSLQKIYKQEEKNRLIQEKYAQKAQIEKEKALQYEQKVRKAIEQTLNKEKEKTLEAQKQIALYKEHLAIRLQDSKTSFGKHFTDDQSSAIISKADLITVDNYKDAIKDTNLEYDKQLSKSKALRKEATLAMKESDTFMKTLVKDFGKMVAWSIVGTALFGTIRQIKQGLDTLKELDTLMVDIAKVTNLSADAMERLVKGSFDASSSYGRTAQDYLKGVAEFSRAGYEELAKGLSEVSLLAQNVGELTAEQANEFLLATDAAYKYGGSQKELTKVLDGVNEIDNKFATSIQKVSEGITVAGSIAANAGVDINELSAAVGTMTAVTQRSGNEAGRAFRSILMNLRQIKGETEDGEIIDDDALSKSAKALNNIGIKIHEVRNGVEELRDPMEILKELSTIWSNLSSMQQAPIIEALGGKFRGNQLVALVENFNMYEKMLAEYANAAGSAMKENEKRMDSWQAKLNQLTNQVSEYWNNAIDSNAVKDIIDLTKEFVGALDNVNQQFGIVASSLYTLTSLLVLFKGQALIGAITKVGGLSAALTALAANPMTWVVVGLGLITTAIIKYADQAQKAKEKTEAINTAYSDFNKSLNSGKIDDVTTSLKKLTDTVDYEGATKKIAALNDEIDRLEGRAVNGRGRSATLSDRQRGRIAGLEVERDALQKQVDMVDNAKKQMDKILSESTDNELRRRNGTLYTPSTTKTVVETGGGDGDKSIPALKDAIAQEELTKELIKSYNKEVDITDQKIKHLERQLKINDEQKDYNKELELTNQLISTQESKVNQLKSANDKIHEEAQRLRDTNKDFNTESWFDINGEATLAYKELLNSFATKSEEIRKNTNLNDKDSIKNANKQIEALEDQKKKVEELFNNIYALKKAWSGNTDEILKTEDTVESLRQTVIKLNEEQQKNLEDVQKQIVEVIKKRYEIEKDEAEKAHKEKIEQLDDELDAYKENINDQIKEIDRLRDKEDFDKSQKKTTDKITELQNERNTLSLAAQSGDLTAIERIKEIDKELFEQRENLSELQQDREDELRKQNLQDMLDEKEKEIKAAKDAEDEKYETIKNNYDKLLEEGNLYAEANKALTEGMVTDINGKLVTVAEAFKTFSDQFGQTLGTLGSNIQTEFIDKLNQAQMLINSMSGLDVNTGISNSASGISTSALNTNSILSGANLSSILDKINLSNIIPSFTMPKISAVSSGGNNVNISVPVNISGGADKVNALEIGNTVAKIIRQELNKSGIFR
jgi:TP901 family phage tail tape measure protein